MIKHFTISVLMFFLFALTNCVLFAQTLYLFSEGDVHDENVGECVRSGIQVMADSLKINMPSDRIVLYNDSLESDDGSLRRWTGPDISSTYNVHDDILKAIDRCPAKSNDTIFFYWCGHGAFDEGGHFLWMPENRGQRAMRRSEILNALKRKNPRLIVFITESCHVLQPFPGSAEAPSSPPQSDVPPLFQHLFFEYSGVVDVNSSSPGQSSAAFEIGGGPFTLFLSSVFRTMSNQSLSWKWIFSSIDSVIAEEYTHCNQKIYIWSLPGDSNHISESRDNNWSDAIYHPENGDRIIAVNNEKIGSEADFRSIIRNAESKIILTMVDHRTGNQYYLITILLPKGSRSRLGIYIKEDNRPGVVVTGVMPGMPGNRCRHLNNGDVAPVGGQTGRGNRTAVNSGGWSGPIYHPENGDRIIEVNGQSIDN